MLIDTHAHIDDEKFESDRDEVVARAKEAGLIKIINMGDSIASSRRAIALTEKYDIVYAGVGVHPEMIGEVQESDYALMAELAEKHDKVVAIGEIGLDYHYTKDNSEIQKNVFIRQLDVARQLNLPVSIHDRDAHGDLMTILKREGQGIRGTIHCYSGSAEMAKDLLKMGWYLGVDGPLTFKNAAKLPEVIATIPLERLLLETDCPYLAPVPKRGTRNEPAYVSYVAQKVAEIRGMSVTEISEITTQNALDLFGLN